MNDQPKAFGLYRAEHEHDGCGVGFVTDVHGRASHDVLAKALEAVANLTHRGAVDAEQTGDGAGITSQLPLRFFAREAERLGVRVERPDRLAVGMVFLPGDDSAVAANACRMFDAALASHGVPVLAWRDVPVDGSVLSPLGRRSQPNIRQVIVARPEGVGDDEFERTLYAARRDFERRVEKARIKGVYVPSFSARTIVYKGLMIAPQLPSFYADLRDPLFETAIALYHQRYSTNTFPNWYLAQPFRLLAHNGEINTLRGNRNWMRAREPELRSELWGDRVAELTPIIQPDGSDSADLDNVYELLVRSGRDPLHAMLMLVPEAWENMANMDADVRAFYEYHACLTEPWDGPAAVSFTDGQMVGAVLDRNGLRPSRFALTEDGLLVAGSEVGSVDLSDRVVVRKGRLGPGEMIAVDTAKGVLLGNDEIKRRYAERRPYGEWLQRGLVRFETPVIPTNGGVAGVEEVPAEELIRRQRAFGYTQEELQLVLRPMVLDAKEPLGSMGDDTPLAVLAHEPRLLYNYFKQKFAQVTNPAIDSLRERLVMSLATYLGPRESIFEEEERHVHLVRLASPILTDRDLAELRRLDDPAFQSVVLSALFRVDEGAAGLERALTDLCEAAAEAVDEGNHLLVLSDRGADAGHVPIPMLAAVGAVHHALIRSGRRMRAAIIAETGEAREMQHFACLIGFGASAVNPYLALETIASRGWAGDYGDRTVERCIANYRKAVEDGVLKIMSKMGISTVSSYQGSQIFEAIGVGQELLDRCFTGLSSRIGGIGFAELARDVLERHGKAFGEGEARKLEDGGFYRFRREGEYHAFNPQVIKALHASARADDPEAYRSYAKLVNGRDPAVPRDLLRFKPRAPIPLEEVEPIGEIMRRFNSAAMSLGALSPEAHETLTIAMNRIGGKSNTGEGGEDASRYRMRYQGGDSPNSRIKQVASARFGVTTEYLAMADELQIKIAQGSKPGEGGQLPGHKVVAHIAALRHAVPGVSLISPPPHHDIYSIEDLAQLIYDLKVVNPRARVCVKLVAEEGVGTIAAGVAKGYADSILISGHDGGTGASPLNSIKHAGAPWELGLAETQQVLMMNDLRGRVTLQTDGGLKTGRDVVIAAMLGADEYGFGTAAVVAIGCQMARQCHLNTCPVGVATQRDDLRAKFAGTPDELVRFFGHVAEDVREILAQLGFRGLEEVIGRTDLLEQVRDAPHPNAGLIDLSPLLVSANGNGRARHRVAERNDRPGDGPMDDTILADVAEAINDGVPVRRAYRIRSVDRTVGARVAGEIAYRYGQPGLPPETVRLRFDGEAGQSFGAFCVHGLRLELVGEANDYVGKGMSGGLIAIRPPDDARFASHENTIIGNTVLYGATGGKLYVAGRAGERFAVRNSGAEAVVEGAGDHCCEYMTAGVVVVLGETGRNFGAGMSNGLAFVLDERGAFPDRYNRELIAIERVTEPADIDMLVYKIMRHGEVTGSRRAAEILADWDAYRPEFWKVEPKSMAKA